MALFDFEKEQSKNIMKGFSNVDDIIEKGRKPFPVGTVKNGYKKIAEGKWKKVSKHYNKTKQEHIDESKKHEDKYDAIILRHKDSDSKTRKIVSQSAKDNMNAHKLIADSLDDKEYSDNDVIGKEKSLDINQKISELNGTQFNELKKMIVNKILKEIEPVDPKHKRGCNKTNLNIWLQGYLNDNQHLTGKQAMESEMMDFFEWYDN